MEPESFSQHEALALLMGRPLALVRADVRLQLQAPPAIHVSERNVQSDVEAYMNYKQAGANGPPQEIASADNCRLDCGAWYFFFFCW